MTNSPNQREPKDPVDPRTAARRPTKPQWLSASHTSVRLHYIPVIVVRTTPSSSLVIQSKYSTVAIDVPFFNGNSRKS
jgi:hypothetical protein